MADEKLLIVDDERLTSEALRYNLQLDGYHVDTASSASEALALLEEQDYPVVITDLRMPQVSGLELCGDIRRLYPNTDVILLTAFGSIENAVEAVKHGAYDYLTKPVDPAKLSALLRRIFELHRLRDENKALRAEVSAHRQASRLIGSAAGMVKVMDRVGVQSLVVSHMQCTATDVRQGNDEVLEATRAHPGRILGYAVIYPVSDAAVAAEMKRCVANGFVGLKLHSSNGFAYTESAYGPALSVANEHCMPVLLHTWGARNDFSTVRELAPRYPRAAFLMAHAGAANGAGECIKLARDQE
ncbi:response regulator, partial [bacterium]|nr:response regulator [bacterium]